MHAGFCSEDTKGISLNIHEKQANIDVLGLHHFTAQRKWWDFQHNYNGGVVYRLQNGVAEVSILWSGCVLHAHPSRQLEQHEDSTRVFENVNRFSTFLKWKWRKTKQAWDTLVSPIPFYEGKTSPTTVILINYCTAAANLFLLFIQDRWAHHYFHCLAVQKWQVWVWFYGT